ncbi:MAG: phosphoribosylamine--glycine ligase [Vicinamibacterales bacterium]
MKILVIGSGAREHTLVWKLAAETGVTGVVCAPGNAGIASLARVVAADPGDPDALLAVARSERVDLTVVGPELPLSRGVVDRFRTEGLPIVGPTRAAAALESSKAFAKAFMARHGVPTAAFALCSSARQALDEIAGGRFGLPVVVKADGLAAGKGVIIATTREEAEAAIREVMEARRFGSAGDTVVLEEFMTGQEASYFVLCDGAHAMPMGSAQDHKRIFDNDEGPNTGGMGAFSPSPLMTPEMEARVLREIVRPVLAGMAAEGHPFSGFLFVGLMLTPAGPKVVEFNVRFGDPEAQVVLPRLAEPLSALLAAAAAGTLPDRAARFSPEPRVGVVLASTGYPEGASAGDVIDGLDAAAAVPGAAIFHAATTRDAAGRFVTAGGRVLTATAAGSTFADAIRTAYEAARRIHFDGMQYRTDIGRRALDLG